MRDSRRQRVFRAVALLLTFSVTQPYVLANLTEARSDVAGETISVQATGRLATRGNRPIEVNGVAAESGATVLSGAQVVTPNDVGATIDLGSLGQLDISPNTVLTLTFDGQNVTVNIVSGCAILTTSEGVNGTVATPQGTPEQTDSSRRSIDICTGPAGSAPIVNQGAAASAGAGASGTTTGTTVGGTVATGGVGGGATSGASTAAIVTFIIAAGTSAAVIVAAIVDDGDDPS